MSNAVCPFDGLSCSGARHCFDFCPKCKILKPVCSRFDFAKFDSVGFPRHEFGDDSMRMRGRYRLG
jgi:hypothetical protein